MAASSYALMRRLQAPSVLVATAVCAGCLPQTPTAQADDVAWLYTIFMVAAAGVFILVAGLLAWTVIRYRGRPDDAELPPQVHGSLRLEAVWWAAPTALVALLAVLTVFVMNEVDARADEPDVTVQVEGFRWGWRFTYGPGEPSVAGTTDDPPELVLPVGTTVAFEITSLDAVHSFSVPEFLIKRDAVPNRTNRFDVVIEEPGTYGGRCGEFCGLLHSYQRFTIRAVMPDEFQAWLAEQAGRADVDR